MTPGADKGIVLGVDGGGTKTLAVALDLDGREIARAKAGSSNIHASSKEEVRETLAKLFDAVLSEAGASKDDIAAACLGMAGCDSERERALFEEYARESLGEGPRIAVRNDGAAAMRALLGGLRGMVVISGTGSICLGIRDGREIRAGGWGHLLADEGGGWRIGLEGLRAYLRAFDGRIGPTTLTARIDKELALSEPRDILTHVYGVADVKPKVAALSRLVVDEAQAGDEAAMAILRSEAGELAALAAAVKGRLFPDERPKLGLWGGNLVHGELYRRLFLEALDAQRVDAEPILDPDAEAVVGAAQCARDMLREERG